PSGRNDAIVESCRRRPLFARRWPRARPLPPLVLSPTRVTFGSAPSAAANTSVAEKQPRSISTATLRAYGNAFGLSARSSTRKHHGEKRPGGSCHDGRHRRRNAEIAVRCAGVQPSHSSG